MLAEPPEPDHVLKHIADKPLAVHHLGNGGDALSNQPGCDARDLDERLDAQARGERDDSNREAEAVNPTS